MCGLDPQNLDETHPDIYEMGPTDEMYKTWDAEWASRRMRWTGEYPGCAECREFGWFTKLIPDQGWVECSKDDPEATENLSRLYFEAVWDVDRQRFVRSNHPNGSDAA